jgi:anti-sigma factor RsiW
VASLDELEVLSRHLAGELDAAESRRVEELLASRPDLADALALLRGLDAAAPALPATLSEAGAAALVGRGAPAAPPSPGPPGRRGGGLRRAAAGRGLARLVRRAQPRAGG